MTFGKLKKLEIALTRDIFSRRGMERLGDLGRDLIFKRTKSGFGVKNNSRQKFKTLSASTILGRSGKISFRVIGDNVVPLPGPGKSIVTGSFGAPKRSNLTLTGQMLDSMTVNAQSQKVEILIPNTKRRGSRLSNSDVAELVSRERPFLALTMAEATIIEKEIISLVRKNVKRIFK